MKTERWTYQLHNQTSITIHDAEGDLIATIEDTDDAGRTSLARAKQIVNDHNAMPVIVEALEGVKKELRPVGKIKDIYSKLVSYEAAVTALRLVQAVIG